MFGFKKDPYHVFRKGKKGETRLEQAERRNELRDKWTWKSILQDSKKTSEVNRYLAAGLCPKCEARVTSTTRDDPKNSCCSYTDYKCSACGFEKSFHWWDDEDDDY